MKNKTSLDCPRQTERHPSYTFIHAGSKVNYFHCLKIVRISTNHKVLRGRCTKKETNPNKPTFYLLSAENYSWKSQEDWDSDPNTQRWTILSWKSSSKNSHTEHVWMYNGRLKKEAQSMMRCLAQYGERTHQTKLSLNLEVNTEFRAPSSVPLLSGLPRWTVI